MITKPDDYDEAWRPIRGLRPVETTEQRMLAARWYVRMWLRLDPAEVEPVLSMLGRDYADEVFQLWREGYLDLYAPHIRGPEAAAAARPRTLKDFWADVPEYLRLRALIQETNPK